MPKMQVESWVVRDERFARHTKCLLSLSRQYASKLYSKEQRPFRRYLAVKFNIDALNLVLQIVLKSLSPDDHLGVKAHRFPC
jgi:hypothetical protein